MFSSRDNYSDLLDENLFLKSKLYRLQSEYKALEEMNHELVKEVRQLRQPFLDLIKNNKKEREQKEMSFEEKNKIIVDTHSV